MSRSIWKGPFTDLIKITPPDKERIASAEQAKQNLFYSEKQDGIKQQARGIAKKVKIWSRRSQIMPLDVGKEFMVHNGRNFVTVKCIESMCSHKWGEFAVTRKKPAHKFNKKRQLHKPIYKKK